MSPKAPVLIIGHTRPILIEQLLTFPLLRERRIYIHIDGARTQEEKSLVQQSIRAAHNFLATHPKCYLFIQNQNLGVRRGPEFAIDWAFEKEKELIILEDDICVTEAFFNFCDVYLEKYRKILYIWQIAGWTPLLDGNVNSANYLSIHTHIWGWATWKNRWILNDRDFELWQPGLISNSKFTKPYEWAENFSKYWDNQIMQVFNGKQAWDTAWMFSMNFYDALSISPPIRLTGNKGFEIGANNTYGITSPIFTDLPKLNIELENFELPIEFSHNLAKWHNENVFGISQPVFLFSKFGNYIFDQLTKIKIKKFLPLKVKIAAKRILGKTT